MSEPSSSEEAVPPPGFAVPAWAAPGGGGFFVDADGELLIVATGF